MLIEANTTWTFLSRAEGHSKADTTVNVYMQQIEAGVKQTLDAIYVELTAKPEAAAGSWNLLEVWYGLVRWAFWDRPQVIESKR